MPRLIPAERGNGKRPSSPAFERSDSPLAVPVLDVSGDTHELVGSKHDTALDPDDDTPLLTGHVLIIDNPAPRDAPETSGSTTMYVGGSTLHEAATEVIGSFEQHARDMPTWVASTDPDLRDVVAEHYTVKGYSTCEAIEMSEVQA